MADKTFIELYEELSKLYESEELTEKDGLKKAAVAAGLLAGGIGAGAGINQAINNYNNTRKIPVSTLAQTAEDEDNYLSYEDEQNNPEDELNKTVACSVSRVYTDDFDDGKERYDQGLSVEFHVSTRGTATFTENELILKGDIVKKFKEYLNSVGTKYRLASMDVRSKSEVGEVIGNIGLASPTFTLDTPYIEDNVVFPISYWQWNDKVFNSTKSVSFWLHILHWQS